MVKILQLWSSARRSLPTEQCRATNSRLTLWPMLTRPCSSPSLEHSQSPRPSPQRQRRSRYDDIVLQARGSFDQGQIDYRCEFITNERLPDESLFSKIFESGIVWISSHKQNRKCRKF